ncbi:MAG: 6-phosphofructokinase [Defluviitaleaceae bacterium]|nr:6-phosphofructokinase [Defluviitaleaceae bacterium]
MRKIDAKKKIGILTSGGDAPGMNAAIRAVVRTAMYHDLQVFGVLRGYEGLIAADFHEMTAKDVSDIIHRGGTILRTARSEEMRTDEGLDRAAQVCNVLALDGLVVIGGDGSLKGASKLARRGVNVFGIPATIDLDLCCSEYTIGFDTAVNTGMDAVNKIRDTSSSHERCSVIEVMGRNCGQIALWCGMTGGAEEIMIPEFKEVDLDAVVRQIMENRGKGKRHNLILVAEGIGDSYQLSLDIERITGIETRSTILGHLQRGGIPTAVDRMHASMMGYKAVELFVSGAQNRVVVMKNGKYDDLDIFEALEEKKPYNHELYDIIKILSI